MSFTDIGAIIRKIDGGDNADSVEMKDLKNKSRETMALSVFKWQKAYRCSNRIRFFSI